LENELVKAFVEEGNDGDDGAALDDDVIQIAFVDSHPMFGEQQVAGRGNGNEFSDSLDDSENDGDNPIRHPWDKRENAK
jgi:hypothetical protein